MGSLATRAISLGGDKWFEPDVALGISKVARNIKDVDALWARRLFWLALARVIRTCCNSRNSTYKLHIKKPADINPAADPVKAFVETIEAYKKHLKDQTVDWSEKACLRVVGIEHREHHGGRQHEHVGER